MDCARSEAFVPSMENCEATLVLNKESVTPKNLVETDRKEQATNPEIARILGAIKDICKVVEIDGVMLASLLKGQKTEEFVEHFRRMGDEGNADEQFVYGLCLEYGQGVGQNDVEAARYFKLSADQGNASAQNRYGLCLASGQGVRQNNEEAAHYYKLSADQGDA